MISMESEYLRRIFLKFGEEVAELRLFEKFHSPDGWVGVFYFSAF
jgi:hypothetical protein